MSIKSIQQQLGVTIDGAWGNQSQTALSNSGKNLIIDDVKLRKNFGSFKPSQVDGINAILNAVNDNTQAKNPLYLAYILATSWHETARTMQPIAEYGKGRGRKYGDNIDIDGSRYQGLPHRYYGRGYVQLTWLSNYKKLGNLIGTDLVNNPDLALEPNNASKIMLIGMLDGLFTGKSLSGCLKSGNRQEFVQARRIINGMDKADLIADYATKFLDCITIG